ncbi:MAG TPA: glycosyltransferase family 87 protein [Stellaceae bacterium]|nr:glycosyltransferase family 87 protein [Stellaceae bacterium]
MTALEPSRPRRLGDLDRERAIVYGWIFLAAQLLLLGYIVLRSNGVIGGASDHTTTDFMMTYASGTLANAGTPAQVYDLAHQAAQQQQIFGPRKLDVVLTFYYPPIYLIACAVLAWLPYLVGFAVWVAATGGLFVAALGRIVRDWRLVVALSSFPAAVVTLGFGQNAFLSAALLSWGMVLIDRRPWLAGFAFGGLAFKPHFLVLLPVALLAGRRWRAIAGGVASSLLLAAVSAAWFGIETWRSFFTHLAMAEDLYGGGAFGYWAQTSLFGAVRLLGGGYGVALAVHAAGMAAAAAATAYGWWKDASLPVRATLLIAGTLVCVPVNVTYDLTAAAGAVAFLCRDDVMPRLRRWEKWLIVAAWLIALVGRGIAEKTGVPLLPLIALGLLAIAIDRLRLESSGRGFPRPARGAPSPRFRRSIP